MKPPFIPEESLKHPNFIPGVPQFSDIVGYLFSDIVGYLFSGIVGYLFSGIVGYIVGYLFSDIVGYIFSDIVGYLNISDIVGYLFSDIVGYLFSDIVGYLFSDIVGHLFSGIVGYLFSGIVGYLFSDIVGYLFSDIVGYLFSDLVIVGYLFSDIVGYLNVSDVVGYLFSDIVGYLFSDLVIVGYRNISDIVEYLNISDIVGYLFSDIVGYLFSDMVGYLCSDIVGYLFSDLVIVGYRNISDIVGYPFSGIVGYLSSDIVGYLCSDLVIVGYLFSDIVGYLFSDIVGYLFSDIVGYLVSDIVGYLYLNFQIPWSVKRRLRIPFNQASALSAMAALGHITPGGQLQPLPAWPRVPWWKGFVDFNPIPIFLTSLYGSQCVFFFNPPINHGGWCLLLNVFFWRYKQRRWVNFTGTQTLGRAKELQEWIRRCFTTTKNNTISFDFGAVSCHWWRAIKYEYWHLHGGRQIIRQFTKWENHVLVDIPILNIGWFKSLQNMKNIDGMRWSVYWVYNGEYTVPYRYCWLVSIPSGYLTVCHGNQHF